jgi:predicted DNA-binding WGR domain protein
MSAKINRASHYAKGNSDKVYVVSIRRSSSGGFDVVASWGRRGSSPQSSQVKSHYNELSSADMAAFDVFMKKMRKGYVDIESRNYNGPVTMSSLRNWIAPELAEQAHGPVNLKTVEPAKTMVDDKPEVNEYVVVCINNDGIEDQFDMNVLYVAENHPDSDWLWVYDKHGKKDEWIAERFEKYEA